MDVCFGVSAVVFLCFVLFSLTELQVGMLHPVHQRFIACITLHSASLNHNYLTTKVVNGVYSLTCVLSVHPHASKTV